MFILRQRGWSVGWAAGRRRDCKKKCKQRKRHCPLPADPAGSARATSRSGRARLSTFACRRDRGGCGDGRSEFRSLRGRCRRSGDKKVGPEEVQANGVPAEVAEVLKFFEAVLALLPSRAALRGQVTPDKVSDKHRCNLRFFRSQLVSRGGSRSRGSSSQRTHSLRVNPLWLSSILLLKKQNVVGLS